MAETWVQLTVELAAIGADDALPTFARAITIYDAGPEALRAVGGEAVVRPR